MDDESGRAGERLARICLAQALMSEISHELRQPLNALSLYLASAIQLHELDAGDGSAVRQALECCEGEVRRVAATISALQGGSEQYPVQSRSYDVNASVRHVYDRWQTPMAHHGIALDFEPDPAAPLALGDPQLLRLALQHLLDSCLDAPAEPSSARRRILLRTVGAGPRSSPVLEVIDRAVDQSLPGQNSPLIRFDGARSGLAGLNWAVSRRLIEAQGGQLNIQRDPDGGTCHRIVLPAAQAASGVA